MEHESFIFGEFLTATLVSTMQIIYLMCDFLHDNHKTTAKLLLFHLIGWPKHTI
jgi:dynactin complex subunit